MGVGYIINMATNGIPVRNPGRYLEQFVKIVQPKSADCLQNFNPAAHLTRSPSTQWLRKSKEVFKKRPRGFQVSIKKGHHGRYDKKRV